MVTTSLCIWLFLAGTLMAYSQGISRVIPPSPEAAALIRHSQMNVSLYTGTPDIAVPFYTIDFQGVTIPISVTYTSGGIKVEDIASWVGLGWNLNAGGLVSRTIRSLPDDGTSGYINTPHKVADLFQMDPNSMNEDGQHNQLIAANASYRDYEADVFNYSIPGHSGQFFYDQTLQKFVQTPYTNLKIEPKKDINRIIGFVITDTRGIGYHFGVSSDNSRSGAERIVSAKTKSLTNYGYIGGETAFYGSPSKPYFQSWMLLDITFPTSNQKISFSYTTEYQVETVQRIQEELIKPMGNCDFRHNTHYLYKEFTQPKIATIIFPEGKIVFERGTTERLDLHHSFPLKKITLFTTEDKLIKEMELHTSYFTSDQSVNANVDYYDEGVYRLKLDSISSFYPNSGIIPPYEFVYDSKTLPDRYANSQDYFGYYNGKNNLSLIPRGKYGFLGYIGDADRSVSPGFTEACMLKKIIYPTRGYDEFVWENNTTAFFLGNPEGYTDHLEHHAIYLTNDYQLFSDPDPNIDFSTTFTISPDSDGVTSFNSMITGCPDPYSFNDLNCDFSLRMYGVTDPTFYLNITAPKFEYILPPGTYKVTAKIEDPEYPDEDPVNDPEGSGLSQMFGALISWTSDADTNSNEFLFGGLRIAQINTYEAPNTLALSRDFRYTLFAPKDTTALSSGTVVNFPNMSMNNYRVYCLEADILDGSTDADEHFIEEIAVKVSSHSLVPLLLTKGALVGYTNVTESYSGSVENGRREYTFSPLTNNGYDNPYQDGSYYDNPFPMEFITPIYTDWRNGNLEKLDYFDASDVLLKTEVYQYENDDTYHAEHFGVQILRMEPGEYGIDNMYIAPYSYTTEWHRLKKMISTDYLDTGDIITTQEFNYDKNPLLASETKTTISTGEVYKTKRYYPDDIEALDGLQPAEIAAITSLSTAHQHRITAPVQTETYTINASGNEKLLSTQRTLYKNWGNNRILPKNMQTAKGNAALQQLITYTDYDDFGNPLEISKAQGTPISYIWGYQHTQPIAKLEGISYADIDPVMITNLQQLSDNDINTTSEAALRDALYALREGYPNALITTYTYNPLIGMTSITDAKGDTFFYQYDTYNRLSQVSDRDGNIITTHQYKYAQKPYDPLIAGISYGSYNNDYQWFISNSIGGSGDYSYAWYKSIGDTSAAFETVASSTSANYKLMVNCSDTRYVKLMVTDNITGAIVEKIKSNKNNCTYPPLTVNITLGTHTVNIQNYSANVSGGSGDYSYAWYEGIGSSSSNFDTIPICSSPDCFDITLCNAQEWVKLVVTDNNTGMTKVIKEKSTIFPCPGEGPYPVDPDDNEQ